MADLKADPSSGAVSMSRHGILFAPRPCFPPASSFTTLDRRSVAKVWRGEVVAPPDAAAYPRVPTAHRRSRRAAPIGAPLAPACRVGRPSGQHAPSRAPLDPRARRGNQTVDVGGRIARAAVGAAVQCVRRRGTRPRLLLAREAAGRYQGPGGSGGPRLAPARLP